MSSTPRSIPMYWIACTSSASPHPFTIELDGTWTEYRSMMTPNACTGTIVSTASLCSKVAAMNRAVPSLDKFSGSLISASTLVWRGIYTLVVIVDCVPVVHVNSIICAVWTSPNEVVYDVLFVDIPSVLPPSKNAGWTSVRPRCTFLAKLKRQIEFSITSERIKDTNTKGCLIDVIMTERHISCIKTPVKLMTGIPSDPKVLPVRASAPYSKLARRMKNIGTKNVWTKIPDWKKIPPSIG